MTHMGSEIYWYSEIYFHGTLSSTMERLMQIDYNVFEIIDLTDCLSIIMQSRTETIYIIILDPDERTTTVRSNDTLVDTPF